MQKASKNEWEKKKHSSEIHRHIYIYLINNNTVSANAFDHPSHFENSHIFSKAELFRFRPCHRFLVISERMKLQLRPRTMNTGWSNLRFRPRCVCRSNRGRCQRQRLGKIFPTRCENCHCYHNPEGRRRLCRSLCHCKNPKLYKKILDSEKQWWCVAPNNVGTELMSNEAWKMFLFQCCAANRWIDSVTALLK